MIQQLAAKAADQPFQKTATTLVRVAAEGWSRSRRASPWPRQVVGLIGDLFGEFGNGNCGFSRAGQFIDATDELRIRHAPVPARYYTHY